MNILIKSGDFQSALADLALKYGVKSEDVIDWSESNGEYSFEVHKTITSDLKANAMVDTLIASNQFASDDIAFICSDGKIHTPNETTLFDRIKSLVANGLTPLIGFSSFINATEDLDSITDAFGTSDYVVFDNLILKRDTNSLTATKFNSVTRVNSEVSDKSVPIELVPSDSKHSVESAYKFLTETISKIPEYSGKITFEISGNLIRCNLNQVLDIGSIELIAKIAYSLGYRLNFVG